MTTKMTGVVCPGNDRHHSNPQTHTRYFFVRKAERCQKPFTRPASLSFLGSSTCRFLLLLASFVALAMTSGCAGFVSGANTTPSTTLDITNVQAVSTTASTSQIVWTTNVPADSVVNYGTTTSYEFSTPVDSAMVTSHQVSLSGLTAGTTYYYQVQSTDTKSNHGKSGGHTFKTGNGVGTPPAITTQPVNQTLTAGQTATFSVVASGTAPLSYQWQKNGTNISGATASSYTTPATATSDSGSTFRVIVTNSAGTATSNAATLTVNAAAVAPAIKTQRASRR